ncbi:MAG: hypothetical protein ACYC35_11520 [Pirellulales bacterium]
MAKRLGVLLAAVVGMAGMARAASLNLNEVPGEATWVVHLDADAARASLVATKAFEKFMAANPAVEKQFAAFTLQMGCDLRQKLHGITLYGKKIGNGEVVLVVRAEVDEKRLSGMIQYAPDYRKTAHRSYQIHSWTDAKGKKDEHTVVGAFFKPQALVLAPSVEAAKVALDAIDGKAARLAGNGTGLAAAVPEGAVLVARAVGLAQAGLPFKSPLVTQSDTCCFAVGEHEGAAFAEGRLTMKTAEIAQQIKAIVEGARALAEVQRSADAQTVKLIRKLRVEVADKTVTCQFRAPAAEVWPQAEQAWDAMAAGASKDSQPEAGATK